MFCNCQWSCRRVEWRPQCVVVVSGNAGGVEGCPQCFVIVNGHAEGWSGAPSVL